jgi:hypothetical protein
LARSGRPLNSTFNKIDENAPGIIQERLFLISRLALRGKTVSYRKTAPGGFPVKAGKVVPVCFITFTTSSNETRWLPSVEQA